MYHILDIVVVGNRLSNHSKASAAVGLSLVVIHRRCFKMAFDDMREVHKRRYLLQPIAVEVFSSDGRNFLLAFPRKTRNKVYDR